MEKTETPVTASKEGKRRRNRCLKKIKSKLEEIKLVQPNKPVRIMFQDEAGFGRINTPKYCWTGGKRPNVPCHHIREYRYVFGAVDPCDGDDCFLIAPQCNTACMNTFLEMLSKQYGKEEILLRACEEKSVNR